MTIRKILKLESRRLYFLYENGSRVGNKITKAHVISQNNFTKNTTARLRVYFYYGGGGGGGGDGNVDVASRSSLFLPLPLLIFSLLPILFSA